MLHFWGEAAPLSGSVSFSRRNGEIRSMYASGSEKKMMFWGEECEGTIDECVSVIKRTVRQAVTLKIRLRHDQLDLEGSTCRLRREYENE